MFYQTNSLFFGLVNTSGCCFPLRQGDSQRMTRLVNRTLHAESTTKYHTVYSENGKKASRTCYSCISKSYRRPVRKESFSFYRGKIKEPEKYPILVRSFINIFLIRVQDGRRALRYLMFSVFNEYLPNRKRKQNH